MIQKTVSEKLKEQFGCKVYKLSLDAGFTCPNRDGTIAKGGCIFCSASGGGEFAEKIKDDIACRLEKAKNRVENKAKGSKYIAYFQAFSGTYGKIERLRQLYYDAISPDYIVGLSVATRPDCLPDEVISLLAEINKIKPVTVELGLQTSNDKTAEYIRRGYKSEVFTSAVARLKRAGIETVAHMIIGLPFETAEDAVNTARFIGDSGADGIKFHLLHVLRGTDLEKEHLCGRFDTLTLEEYTDILKACLEVLPEDIIIHRLTGDGAKRDLVSPLWSADKKRVLNHIKRELNIK